MLRVRALSGAAELDVGGLKARLQASESSLVVVLKRCLGAQLGCSRFRLMLLGIDRKEILEETLL